MRNRRINMKRIFSVLLVIAISLSVLAVTGCDKKEEAKPPSQLLIGDWYTYSGAPYRSFLENGTVTGTSFYSSPYTVEEDTITWESASGERVTVSFYTDGEILRIASDIGSYFTARRYYYRSAEGVPAGTGLPEKGTSDENIFGLWYNGDTLFFALGSDCSVSHYPTADSFFFDGESLVLLKADSASDEAAKCSLSGNTLTIFYTDELTGSEASLVLTRK